MKGDYLWDRSGGPDPEIQRLEQTLETLRYEPRLPDFPEILVSEPERPRYRQLWSFFLGRPALTVSAMVMAAALITVVWLSFGRRAAYEVASLSGAPRIGNSLVAGSGRLRVGQWLVTDATARARVRVGEIGEVEVEPNTRIGLLRARDSEHRLLLERGAIRAFILAPPRRFFVNTPSAQAVDLGCSYTLEVGDDGAGLLHVTTGWVAFEHKGRESFVPAGASCMTRPGSGPGTPYMDDASLAFRAALEKYDFDSAAGQAREEALAAVLRESRKEDSLTLWHLLARGDEAAREQVYDRLAALIPPPDGVKRDGVLKRDHRMLDLWWNRLGLGDTEWWRIWERPWPSRN